MAFMEMPPPLKNEVTIQLLIDHRAGDETAREKVIEGNLRLVMHLARKFENTGILLEDLVSIGMIGLIKAVNTFDVDKLIKFATYASRCINNEILMFLRKGKKDKGTANLDDVLTMDWDGNELTLMDVTPDNRIKHFSESFVEQDTREEVQEAIKGLPEQYQEIIRLRYFEDKTQKEVSTLLGLSQSYISRLEKKTLKRIKKSMAMKEEKLRRKENMAMAHKGNRQRAIQLLKETTRTYKEVSEESGVPLGTVAALALEHRPENVRRELASLSQKHKKGMKPGENTPDTDKAVEMLAEGKYSYADISIRTGVPQGSLTRLRRLYEAGEYEWKNTPAKKVAIETRKPVETPVIQEEAFMGEKDLAAKKAAEYDAKKEYVMVEKSEAPVAQIPTKSIADAVEDFKADIRAEYKEELRKEIEQEMSEKSPAYQTSNVGAIQKRFTFKYDASGGKVPTEDFVAELQDLIGTLEASGNQFVTFTFKVEAE